MRVRIRPARDSDALAVADLFLRARHAAAAAGSIPPTVHPDDDVRSWVTESIIPKLACWLAEDESGPIVGVLVLDADGIDQLYVAPGQTGAGIGSELIAVAKRERPGGLQLWTFASNVGAQRFYARHGFREVGHSDGSDNEEGAPAVQYLWTPA